MAMYRVGFLMSQMLGHITHDQRLRFAVAEDNEIRPEWMPIFPWREDRWQRMPVIKKNMTLANSFRARSHLSRKQSFNALYFHTQEAALLAKQYMKKIPTILSLDATPINNRMMRAQHHKIHDFKPIARAKDFLTKKAFARATHLVAFNHWTKDSLTCDYGIPEQKISVIRPGIDLNYWKLAPQECTESREAKSPRVLFVGGDFVRKGGDILVQCAACARGEWHVDTVTRETVKDFETIRNLRVHRGLKPNAPELLNLYRQANIFALPTLIDCSPWVILEAMAMQLPVITTNVGAISEMVVHGETGLLIPPNSPEALTDAIRALGRDPNRRLAMGIAGRQRVRAYFDAACNYRQLITLIKTTAETGSLAQGH